ncbi:hypothetical protein A2U01_0059824, partial [Trifolium medium]|nr:hypothetical protein [Trifolium medium]
LARFSEATIKVSNPNQEMFVAAFHNGLKAGQFNESLAQKPAATMQEIMKRVECYIKGGESNVEKRNRDSREKPTDRRSQKDIREEETSGTAGTKAEEVDAPTSNRGTVAQEHTGRKKNIHA